MSVDNKPVNRAPLVTIPHLDALVPESGLPAELDQFQEKYNELFSDWYSIGMDQAIGIQRASIQAAAQMQSEMIDSYKGASWCTPEIAGWLDAVADTLSACMQWQLSMLSLLVPVSPAPALPPSKDVSPEGLAEGMDLGTGQRRRSRGQLPSAG